MSKVVTLRKSGNSLIFTAPSDLQDEIGSKYQVKKGSNGTIIYEPIKHKNVFSKEEWQNYDFQSDLNDDSNLKIEKPVGKEKLD